MSRCVLWTNVITVVFNLLLLHTSSSFNIGRLDPVNLEKYPVVLVPGDGGSQAYCQPNDSSTDPFLLWVNLKYFFQPGTLAKYFSLTYDPVTKNTSDGTFGTVIFPGWGETWSIENLDTNKYGGTEYFGPLVQALKQDTFFVSNFTIRGTPFDFRKAPNQNADFVQKMRLLIEETYKNAGNRKIILVGHSLGSKYCLYFLKAQSREWKKTYLKSFLSVSGPLGGSIKALKIEASGDNFGVFVRSPLSFREVQRSMPSLTFLLPDPRLWPRDQPLIVTPNKNYSAHDYEEFFKDINYTLGYQMMLDTKKSVDGFEGPTDIDEVYCIHGSGLATTGQMVYSPPSFFHKGFPDQTPLLIPEDGDGTVSMRSLEVCRNWPGAKYIVLPSAEHLRIVGDPRFISFMRGLVGAQTKE